MPRAAFLIFLVLTLAASTGTTQAQPQGPGPIAVKSQAAKGGPGQGPEGSAKAVKAAVKDPFLPPLEQASLKIRYQYTGRYVGEEILVVKGQRRLSELKAVDTAFGLDRSVHRLTLETPERIVRLDLIAGSGQARPNLRGVLSRMWQDLDDEAKFHLNQNLPVFALALGAGLKVPSATTKEAQLGLPAIRINLGPDQAWYWTETDLVLGQVGVQGGWRWKKTAIDIQANVETPESLFNLAGSDRLEVRAEDQAWTEDFARRVMTLLVRPLVGLEAKYRREEEPTAKAGLVVPIAWPVPAPPGYRSEAERYRLQPDWRPYPLPPTERPWPPPGLGRDLLAYETEPLAERLSLKIKESLGSPKPQEGGARPRAESGKGRPGAGSAQ